MQKILVKGETFDLLTHLQILGYHIHILMERIFMNSFDTVRYLALIFRSTSWLHGALYDENICMYGSCNLSVISTKV